MVEFQAQANYQYYNLPKAINVLHAIFMCQRNGEPTTVTYKGQPFQSAE